MKKKTFHLLNWAIISTIRNRIQHRKLQFFDTISVAAPPPHIALSIAHVKVKSIGYITQVKASTLF